MDEHGPFTDGSPIESIFSPANKLLHYQLAQPSPKPLVSERLQSLPELVVLSVVPLGLIDVDFWVGSEDFYIPSVGSDSSDSESQLSPSKYAGGF